MELKGSNNWSDLDSEERDPSAAKEDAPKQRPVEALSERKAPLFNLGVIYSRQPEFDSTFQKEVYQERDRNAPEVAQGVTLGVSELGGVQAPGAESSAEQAAQAAAAAEAKIAYAEDDDEDEEDGTDKDKKTAAVGRTSVAKPRVAPAHNLTPVERPTGEDTLVSPPNDQRSLQPSAAVEEFNRVVHQEAELALPFDPLEYKTPTKPLGGEDQSQHLPPPEPTEYRPPGAGSSNVPPPERPTPAPQPEPEPRGWGSEPNPQVVGYTYNTLPPQPNPSEHVTRRQFETGLDDTRRRMAARMIVVALLAWYVGHRPVKPLRKQVGELQQVNKEQAEQLTRLSYEQQQTQARIAEQNRQIEQFTQPKSIPFQPEVTGRYYLPGEAPIASESQPQTQVETAAMAGEPSREVTLLENEHVEVPAAGYAEVVNREGKVVTGAMPHGEAYWQDRAPERVLSQPSVGDSRFSPGGMGGAGSSAQPVAGSTGVPVLPSVQDSQGPAGNALFRSGQLHNQDARQLLNTPKSNPIVSALTSPWLWLGVGILLIAFFAAATI